MGLISWLLVGGLSGWIASKIMAKNFQMGMLANIIVGIIGAFIGGIVMKFLGQGGVSGFNIWSLFVATLGSVILLWIANKIRS